VRFTDICLEHTGYTDAALLGRKTERNLRLLQLQEADDPDDPFTLFNLGWVYQDLGQAPKAIPYLRRSLALSGPGDSIVRKLYVLLAQAHRMLGQQRPALAACRAGRAHCPDDPELLFLEAQILREQGDPAGAEKCLRQLLQLRPGTHFASLDAGVRGVKARNQLALVCWEQGRATEAEEAWQAVLAEQPRFTPAWQGLGELYVNQGRWAELDQAVDHLCADDGHALDGALLRARGHLARKEFGPSRQLLEETVAQNPRALAPRVFLSHVLLQSQDLAAAEPALRAVLELDPCQAEAWRNLAVLLNSQHHFEQAAEACQGGLSHCPGEPNLLRLQRILHQQAAGNHTNGNLLHHAPKDRLRLAFASFSPFAFTTDTPYQEPLGGSESALCYLAEALSQQGHEVFLLNQGMVPAVCRGVSCLPLSEGSIGQLGRLDAFIVQNFAGKGRELRTLLSAHTPLVFWSQHAHDQPAVQALRDPAECQAYDFMVFVSDWQRQQFIQHFGLDPERTVVRRNAIGPAFSALFADNTPVLAQKARPPVLAYTSTPFRGLDLLLDAFPLIRRAVPEVVLKVYSSMQVYHVAETEEAQYASLYRKCRETEGVEYIGSLPQPELAGQLRAASVLAYPNTFAETSCIAVLEAMASGCRVVTSDLGALPETCAGFAPLIPLNGDRAIYLNHFVEETVRVLQELAAPDTAGLESFLRRQLEHIDQTATWPMRAQEWIARLQQRAVLAPS
jgi:glycosyltransferase involved in cell wall biosynthesis/Tfp pilus assembly protein PilF